MFCELLYWTNHVVCKISLIGTSGTSRSRGTSRNKGRNGRKPAYVAYVQSYEKGNSFSIVELVCTDIKLFVTFKQNVYAHNTREKEHGKFKKCWSSYEELVIYKGLNIGLFSLIIMQQTLICSSHLNCKEFILHERGVHVTVYEFTLRYFLSF